MSAYVVVSYRVTHPEGFAPYAPAAIPTLMAHGAEVIVADSASHAIEGAPGDRTVILKFASKEAAMAWYNSPEYQAVIKLRTDNSEGTMVLVDGYMPPV
jgi:uncharacterized protein (DUF1330 family)